MTEGHGTNDGNHANEPKQEHADSKHAVRHHIVYSVFFSLLFVFLDLLFLWPESHFFALLVLAAVGSAVAWAELSRDLAILSAMGCFTAAFLTYEVVGPTLPIETETHGWLYPANDRSADTECGPGMWDLFRSLEDESKLLIVALGDSGAQITFWDTALQTTPVTKEDIKIANWWNSAPRTVLQVGTCKAIIVRRVGGGISIDTDVFKPDGSLAVRIRNNEFHIVSAQTAFTERPDRSTLNVTGTHGEELFWARFLNPRSLKIRGYFACEGFAPVHIADNAIEIANEPHIARLCSSLGPKGVGMYVGVTP